MGMSIFISHSSALEYWRRVGVGSGVSLSHARPRSKMAADASLITALTSSVEGEVTSPLDVVVAEGSSRLRMKGVACHVWSGPEADSFVQVEKGLYVSCPEACFLQLATKLPLPKLVEVGFELCGSYALASDDAKGFQSRKPLTTITTLGRYVAKSPGIHGVKPAARALKFIAEGSASPMETILVILLCLPASFGGYGLELPQVNYRIVVPESMKKLVRQEAYWCDLYWKQAKLAIEYDSDMFHTDTYRIAHDAKRRNELTHLGLSVMSVTRRQVYDARELDEIAHLIARRIGKRMRCVQKDVLTKRYELRQLLLKDKGLDGVSKSTMPRAEYIDF